MIAAGATRQKVENAMWNKGQVRILFAIVVVWFPAISCGKQVATQDATAHATPDRHRFPWGTPRCTPRCSGTGSLRSS